jgi:HJR/Mrr/RecB family endonuclease
MTFSDNYKGPFFDIYDEEWTDEERKILDAWIEGRRWVTRMKVEQIIEQMDQRKHAKMLAIFQHLANGGEATTDDELEEWDELFEYFEQHKAQAECKSQRQFWFDLSPREFELEVAKLYCKEGWKTSTCKLGADGGIDIDCRRASERLLVQCKQHILPVGVQVIREMAGVAAVEHAQVVVIGLNGFTEDATSFANRAKVLLLTVEDLMRMAQ